MKKIIYLGFLLLLIFTQCRKVEQESGKIFGTIQTSAEVSDGIDVQIKQGETQIGRAHV